MGRSRESRVQLQRVHRTDDSCRAATFEHGCASRPGARGDRDRWGDNHEPTKIADWYAKGFEPVFRKRCESCHGPIHLHARYEWGGKWGWIDLSQPESSPALTEVEELVTDWMRQMLGLSDAWSGVIQDTASTSTLVALLCARERASGYSLARGGLQYAARRRERPAARLQATTPFEAGQAETRVHPEP